MIRRLPDRVRMVERQIVARGVDDPAVVHAFVDVPRHAFVPSEAVPFAYEDRALPIAEGQTISQPYIVALMTEAAEVHPEDRVLEVGTGSGYQAAILGRLARQVFTVERHARLAEEAQRRFAALGYDNIRVRVGDGTLGWEDEAPFDAIVVTAGGPEAIPPALLDQLAPGGRLVIPAGPRRSGQQLMRVRRSADGQRLEREALGAVRFVPLIGAEGWEADPARSRGASAPPTDDPVPPPAGEAEPPDDVDAPDPGRPAPSDPLADGDP